MVKPNPTTASRIDEHFATLRDAVSATRVGVEGATLRIV
jgi:hypothetical protein